MAGWLPPPQQQYGIGDQLAAALSNLVAAKNEGDQRTFLKQKMQHELATMAFEEKKQKMDQAQQQFDKTLQENLLAYHTLNGIDPGMNATPQGLPPAANTLEAAMANMGGVNPAGGATQLAPPVRPDMSMAGANIAEKPMPVIPTQFTPGGQTYNLPPKSDKQVQQDKLAEAAVAAQIAGMKSYAEQKAGNQANIDLPSPTKISPKDVPHLPTPAELAVLGEYGKSVNPTVPITETQLEKGRQAFDADRANARMVEQNKVAAATRAEAGAQRIADKTASLADKSYNKNYEDLKKYSDDVNTNLTRIQRLEDTLSQPNMVVDSLVAPELLTAMAGGMGSGLRINEAEINRVVGGRPVVQDIRAKLNKIMGGDTAVSILPEERANMLKIVELTKSRGVDRNSIINDTRDKLLENADKPAFHKQLMNDFNKKWSESFTAGPPTSNPPPVNPSFLKEGDRAEKGGVWWVIKGGKWTLQ